MNFHRFGSLCSSAADRCRNLPGRAWRNAPRVGHKSPPVQLTFSDRSSESSTGEQSERGASREDGRDTRALLRELHGVSGHHASRFDSGHLHHLRKLWAEFQNDLLDCLPAALVALIVQWVFVMLRFVL
jgi:hypothetical protein